MDILNLIIIFQRNLTEFENVRSHGTRQAKHDLILPRCRTSLYAKSFSARGSSSWNSINDKIRETNQLKPSKDD